MEPLICPVCETENGADAVNCEVCGERLSALEPGEVLSPEENVSSMLADSQDAPQEGDAFGDSAFEDDDYPSAAADAVSNAILEEQASEASNSEARALDGEQEHTPQVLYSPLDGTAYPVGTAQYEDGFGDMGEELVATPPEDMKPEDGNANTGLEAGVVSDGSSDIVILNTQAGSDAVEPSEAAEPSAADVSESESLSEDSYIDAAGISGSPQFREMFKSVAKTREPQAPLPQPGIHANPATLCVYVNREEAHRHYIELDETLLGRRDPNSDAYPDLDLTSFDEQDLISRKHVYVYRQNKNYTLYVVSNAGTQLNNELLSLGDRRTLKSDDVIVLAGILAIKFELATS